MNLSGLESVDFLSLAEMQDRRLKFIPGYEVFFNGHWKWDEQRQGWERVRNG